MPSHAYIYPSAIVLYLGGVDGRPATRTHLGVVGDAVARRAEAVDVHHVPARALPLHHDGVVVLLLLVVVVVLLLLLPLPPEEAVFFVHGFTTPSRIRRRPQPQNLLRPRLTAGTTATALARGRDQHHQRQEQRAPPRRRRRTHRTTTYVRPDTANAYVCTYAFARKLQDCRLYRSSSGFGAGGS